MNLLSSTKQYSNFIDSIISFSSVIETKTLKDFLQSYSRSNNEGDIYNFTSANKLLLGQTKDRNLTIFNHIMSKSNKKVLQIESLEATKCELSYAD